MKRKILFLVGLVGLVAVVTVGMKLLGNRSPKQGELRVDSQPTASVFLDNKHVGRTPLKNKFDAGEYTVKLVPESAVEQRASWEGKVTVGQNLLTYINGSLAESDLATAVDVLWLERISSKKSELSILTNPDGATVLLDNETKGITPLSLGDVSPGEQMLTVTSPGFLSRSLRIKASPGYKLIASIKLALSPGGLTPEASPSPTLSGTPTPKQTGTKPSPTKTATSSATIPDPPKPFVIIKETPTGFLRVRMEPSTSATESARVTPGEKYSIFDTQSGWYKIKYDGTNTGWISGQYAEKVE